MVLSPSRRVAQVSSSEDFVQETRRTDEIMKGKRRKYADEEKETERKRRKDEGITPPKEVKPDEVEPIGEPVKVTGRGRGRRTHYGQFDYRGNRYRLEDSVLLNQVEDSPMPYIAIIKEITQKQDGSMMIMGQWFYRQEEAKKEGGGYWEGNDKREVFYSFHRDEVPAESVMHRCMVYFVPAHKQLPKRRDNPGFIVQKVYDTDEKKLRNLTDKDYEVAKQHEIDILVEKSMSRLGDLPDLETEEVLDRGKSIMIN